MNQSNLDDRSFSQKPLVKPELTIKYLQYFKQKQPSSQGFTFIEMTVLFIIIFGALTASVLNYHNPIVQQVEPKTYVEGINRGQQAYFTKKGRFGTDIPSLDIGMYTETDNYIYSTSGSGGGTGTNQTAYSYSTLRRPNSGMKNYSGMVSLTQVGATSAVTSVAIICETIKPDAPAIKPINGTTCASGSTPVRGYYSSRKGD